MHVNERESFGSFVRGEKEGDTDESDASRRAASACVWVRACVLPPEFELRTWMCLVKLTTSDKLLRAPCMHTHAHICVRCGESMVEHTCTHNDHDLQHQHPQHHDAEDSAAHLIDRPHAVVDEVGRHEERKRENDRVVLAVRV